MRNYKDNAIVKMSFEFALGVNEFAEILRGERKLGMADQVLSLITTSPHQHIDTFAHL